MPIKMAKTGAPTTGKKLPKVQEMMEMIRQAKSPAPFFDKNDIKTSEISTSYYSLVSKKSKEKVKFNNYLTSFSNLCDNSCTRTVTKSWQKQKYQSSTSGISVYLVILKLNSGYIFLSRLSSHFLTIHSEMTLRSSNQ